MKFMVLNCFASELWVFFTNQLIVHANTIVSKGLPVTVIYAFANL